MAIEEDEEEVQENGEEEDEAAEEKKPRRKTSRRNEVASPSPVFLFDGEALDFKAAGQITAAYETRYVVLAGDSHSGKSTLIVSIYERFQEGSFASHSFAGSRTLMAFERMSWKSRISSELDVPDTARTDVGKYDALHLTLKKSPDAAALGLLFPDISGEEFREARNVPEACRNLQLLRRADHLAILIDGEKLNNMDRRQEALHNARILLQRILDEELPPKKMNVQLVITKFDLLSNDGIASKAESFIKQMGESFAEIFGERVGRIKTFKIAARPIKGTLGLAFGVESLMKEWLEYSPFLRLVSEPASAKPDTDRQFGKFFVKELG